MFSTIVENQAGLDFVYEKYIAGPRRAKAEARKPQGSASYEPRPVSLDDDALIAKAVAAKDGEAFQRLMDGDWVGYRSQSEADQALCNKLAFWTAKDPARMDRIFRASGLYSTISRKGNPEDYLSRTIQNAIDGTTEVYQERRQEKPARTQQEPQAQDSAEDERPVIQWEESQIHIIIEQVQDILVDKWMRGETPVLYRRPEGVVRIGKVESNSRAARFNVKRDADGLMLYPVEAAWLHAYLSSIIDWQKYYLKTGWKSSSCPKPIVDLFLAKRGELRIPFLTGIINCPTMRPDGSILDQPGYDNDTGLFFDAGGVDWPQVPENPPREEAELCRDILLDLLSEFPFKTEAGRSVAVAYILTCLVRRILPKAPGFGFSARMQGTGKTYLANAGSLIATGCDGDLMAPPEDEAEMRKCLTSLLIEGSSVIIIDNVMRTFFSVNLCSILTSPTFKGRILGQSRTPTVSTNTTIAVTGNHLTFKGDTTRRFLLCDLDAETEKPEERSFKRNLEAYIKQYRADLVIAGLTLLRAFFLSTDKPRLKPYGSFEDWSFLVRGAVVWIGLPDPYESKAEIEENDPVREGHILVIEAWRKAFGDEPVKIEDALNHEKGSQELVDALNMAVRFKGKALTVRDVGYWMRSREGVFINGMCFKKSGGNTKAYKYKVMVR